MSDSFMYRYQVADDAATVVVNNFDSGYKSPGAGTVRTHPLLARATQKQCTNTGKFTSEVVHTFTCDERTERGLTP